MDFFRLITGKSCQDVGTNYELSILGLSSLGTGACCVAIGANDHRMDFCLVHNIAKWS